MSRLIQVVSTTVQVAVCLGVGFASKEQAKCKASRSLAVSFFLVKHDLIARLRVFALGSEFCVSRARPGLDFIREFGIFRDILYKPLRNQPAIRYL